MTVATNGSFLLVKSLQNHSCVKIANFRSSLQNIDIMVLSGIKHLLDTLGKQCQGVSV